MHPVADLDSALLNALPADLHARIPALARLLNAAAGNAISPDELQRRLSAEPQLVLLLEALAGRTFAVGNTSVRFTEGEPQTTGANAAGPSLVVVQTGGGDYAAGNIDKRQGQFFEGGIHIHYTAHPGQGPQPALPLPEPARPPEPGDFVGREAELAYFTRKLSEVHIAVIAGMAGMGKTTLAAALARQAADPDKVFWHAFHAGEGIDTIIWRLAGFLARQGRAELWQLLQSAAQTGGQPPPPELLFDYLTQELAGQGYLLCLDDFQFLDGDPLLEHLARQLRARVLAGDLSLIVTSRRMPAFVQTIEFVPLSGLSAADTRRLAETRGLSLDGGLATALHAHTEGNAQLLTLAIDALRRAPNPARLLEQLAEADHIERYLMAELDARLTDEERAVMSAVAVLLGYPGTREAIEAIADTSGVRRALGELSGRYLLTVVEGEQGKRYGQHAIVQAFYYNLLGRRERQALHRRAGSYYEHEEPDALKAARHLGRAGDQARAAGLATADVWALINAGQARALSLLLAEFAAERLDAELWVAVSIARGELHAFLGESKPAQQSFQEALRQLDAQPASPQARERRARACGGMGAMLKQEAPEAALRWLQRGLDELASDDIPLKADLQLKVGSIQIALGAYAGALQSIERGLALLPEGTSQLRAGALINLGVIYCAQGDVGRGNAATLEGLAMSQDLHDYWVMLKTWHNLGVETEIAGDWNGAIDRYRQALELAQRLGNAEHQTLEELALGIISMNQGDDQLASQHLSNSLALARGHGLREYLVGGLSSTADLHIRQGAIDAAAQELAEAEQIALEMESSYQLPEIYRGWSQVYRARGNTSEARAYAERAIEQAGALGLDLETGVGLRILGLVLLADGQDQPALAAFGRSMALLADRDPYEAARTSVAWGRALRSAGDARAGAMLGEARAVFARLGARRDLAQAAE